MAAISNYRQIVQIAKRAGIPWVVLGTQPSVAGSDRLEEYRHIMHFPRFAQGPELFVALWARYSEAIRQVTQEEGATLIDMAEVIRREVPDSGRYFLDSVHMSCEGYEVLGRKVFEQLDREGAWKRFRKG